MAEITINNTQYRVTPLRATEALLLKAKVLKQAGAALGHLDAIMIAANGAQSATPAAIAERNAAAAKAFGNIFSSCDPKQLVELLKEICSVAMIMRPSGTWSKLDFDGDMSDRQNEIIPLVMFVLEEQFAGFFDGLPAVGNRSDQAPG